MSLMIDVDKVEAVLLADGWHEIADRSFRLDSYEFVWGNQYQRDNDEFTTMHGGGQSGICATGFAFHNPNQQTIAGPLTAILAVRSSTRLAYDTDEPAND
jgi:hypothetical protein